MYQNPPICRKHNIMKTWKNNCSESLQNLLIKICPQLCMYAYIYVFMYIFMSPVN